MTFNDNARIDTRTSSRRSGRGRTGGVIAGGGGVVVLLLALGSQLFGVNLLPFAPVVEDLVVGGGAATQQEQQLENCATGADANANTECRMAATANSLDVFWQTQVSNYRSPHLVLYSGQTSSPCGTASNQVGPFYCPTDEQIYVDVSFFDQLRESYGASAGALAQEYVLAHEWGHHISNLIGTLSSADRGSGADSGSVRLELQADCFAGSWIDAAVNVPDEEGLPFMEPVTREQLADAMNAAAAVGDDHIMEQSGMGVNPDRFTHGTSEQRQRWLTTGYEDGPTACSTFDVGAGQL